jgi:hypothetical protein
LVAAVESRRMSSNLKRFELVLAVAVRDLTRRGLLRCIAQPRLSGDLEVALGSRRLVIILHETSRVQWLVGGAVLESRGTGG